MSIVELYLNQSAEIAPKSGRDLYGKPTTGTVITVKCRFQEAKKTTKDSKGQEVGADAEIWLMPTVSLAIDDEVTVSGQKYRVVNVSKKFGLDGQPDHIKGMLFLKSA